MYSYISTYCPCLYYMSCRYNSLLTRFPGTWKSLKGSSVLKGLKKVGLVNVTLRLYSQMIVGRIAAIPPAILNCSRLQHVTLSLKRFSCSFLIDKRNTLLLQRDLRKMFKFFSNFFFNLWIPWARIETCVGFNGIWGFVRFPLTYCNGDNGFTIQGESENLQQGHKQQ